MLFATRSRRLRTRSHLRRKMEVLAQLDARLFRHATGRDH